MPYLDNAATTFPKPPEVTNAMLKCMQEYAVNSGRGVYASAHKADNMIKETRTLVSDLVGLKKGKTIFSPSITVALNQIIQGLEWKKGDIAYVTPFEHNSVVRPLEFVSKNFGVTIKKLPVIFDGDFRYDLGMISELFLMYPPRVLIATHVSNVTGAITPLRSLLELSKEFNAVTVVDGAQGAALLPLDGMDNLVDFYAFSGHKSLYGPFGVAGFITNSSQPLKPLLHGGTGSHSENKEMPDEPPFAYEPGSHNIVSIAGLNAACKWLQETSPQAVLSHERTLVSTLLDSVESMQHVKTYGEFKSDTATGIISINVENYLSQEVAMVLEQKHGIQVRAGFHCAPSSHEFLGTQRAGTVRISFGYYNSENEVQELISCLEQLS